MDLASSSDTNADARAARASSAPESPLLQHTALVWLGYVLILALIDTMLLPPAMPAPGFYLVHLAGAVALLVFAGRAPRTPSAGLPLSIGWIVALATLAALPMVAGRLPSGAESVALRSLPIMMLALVLVAWRYHWREVIAFSAVTALLSGVPLLVPAPTTAPPMGPAVVAAAIQTTSFLAVGGAVALLMRQLRAQQQALENANHQLRQLADIREQLAVSHERSRIARELHDTLAHTLSGLSIQLEGADACWDHDPPRARAIIRQAHAVVRGGLGETRRALRALRAGPIEQHGLVAALQHLATSSAARAGLRLEIALPAGLPPLSEVGEHCVYRVAQEAITNVVCHAAATTLWVQLEADTRRVELLVRDDGRGFHAAPAARADQYGLRGLRERTAALGGELNVVSTPGHGTTVRLIIAHGWRAYESADL